MERKTRERCIYMADRNVGLTAVIHSSARRANDPVSLHRASLTCSGNKRYFMTPAFSAVKLSFSWDGFERAKYASTVAMIDCCTTAFLLEAADSTHNYSSLYIG